MQRPSTALAALALALLLGLQPLATDLYLPALPMLTRALAAPMAAAQLTLAALMLAFGIGQLAWGPAADRWGRRPVLLAGLSLHVAAGALCALAPTVQWLIAGRALQGAALAAAVVVARAIVRDLYEPHEGAQIMALALAGLALVAIGGPLVGGVVAAGWGWRAALALVAVCGAAALAFIALRWPETARWRDPQALQPGPLFATWRRIARDRRFAVWTLLGSSSYGGVFTMLAGSSFVYIDLLGWSAREYGLAMASVSSFYLGSTLLCRRWIARLGLVDTVRRGACFTAAAGLLVLLAGLAGARSVWALLLPQWLYIVGHGLHQPCWQTAAVAPFPAHAGAAAALSGCLLALVAFGVGRWLGAALHGGVLPYAATIAFWALLTAALAWFAVPRVADVTR